MKKTLLVTLFTCLHCLGYGQPSDLTDSDWYIDLVYVAGLEYESPIHPSSGILNPNIEFLANKVYAVIDPESDSFFGTIDYDVQDQRFTITEPAITLPGCQIYCDFAGKYFELLFGDGIEIVFDWAIILMDGGEKALHITRSDGSYALFNDHPPLSIDEQQKTKIMLVPNPVIDILHISSEDFVVEEIYIYDLTGKRYTEILQNESYLDVSSLLKGMYFLELNTTHGRTILKFIKE